MADFTRYQSITRNVEQSANASKSPIAALSTINLDFSTDIGKDIPKRSSFLPGSWMRSPSERIKTSAKQCTFQAQGMKKFCTGSRYIGEVNEMGMCGKGIYKFPHNVIYDGYFNKRGEFHGTGILIYPGGQRIEGLWKNGKLMKGANCISKDESALGSEYCRMPDRRFQIEVKTEVLPAGQEYLTNAPTPRKIPSGMYDVGSGFYDPKSRVLIDTIDTCKYESISAWADKEKKNVYKILTEKTKSQIALHKNLEHQSIPRPIQIEELPTEAMEEWIKDNCRKAWDQPTGYRPDLYEVWTPGYKSDKYNKRISDTSIVTIEGVRCHNPFQASEGSKRTCKLYSFIINPMQLKEKYVTYLRESRKGSARELWNLFVQSPTTKRAKRHALQERKGKKAKICAYVEASSLKKHNKPSLKKHNKDERSL